MCTLARMFVCWNAEVFFLKSTRISLGEALRHVAARARKQSREMTCHRGFGDIPDLAVGRFGSLPPPQDVGPKIPQPDREKKRNRGGSTETASISGCCRQLLLEIDPEYELPIRQLVGDVELDVEEHGIPGRFAEEDPSKQVDAHVGVAAAGTVGVEPIDRQT